MSLTGYVLQLLMGFRFQLGAGTSLPGLTAAKLGAEVTLTDDFNKLEVLFVVHLYFEFSLRCGVLRHCLLT